MLANGRSVRLALWHSDQLVTLLHMSKIKRWFQHRVRGDLLRITAELPGNEDEDKESEAEDEEEEELEKGEGA